MQHRFEIICHLKILSNVMICILYCSFIGYLEPIFIFESLQVTYSVIIFTYICWRSWIHNFIPVHFVVIIFMRAIIVISNFLGEGDYILMIYPIF